MSASPIVFDSRWIGPHGIGRFAGELQSRLSGITNTLLSGSPTHPLDAVRLGRTLPSSCAGFFSPGFNAPLSCLGSKPSRFVFTIHDLIHVNYRSEASLPKRLYYNLVVKPAAKRAFRVLTVSEYSKQEIVKWAGIPPQRVEVVYNGVGAQFTASGPRRASDRPYLFYVGNYKPHKNFRSLLSALATAKAHCNVKILATGVASAELLGAIDRLGLGSSVEFLGHLTDAQLAEAYRGAAATVLPSEYEGFGLPVIESMACGTAVVCSNATSLPEVAGGAAELVGTDSDSIAEGILRVINDRDRQEQLVALGGERASEFSWHSTASRVQRVLDEMLCSDDLGHGGSKRE